MTKPTPEQVKSARVAAGLTQQACADRFGYQLRNWQRKEESGATGTTLSICEYEFLMLLAGIHPDFTIQRVKTLNFSENSSRKPSTLNTKDSSKRCNKKPLVLRT